MDSATILEKVKADKVKFILLQFSDILGISKSITLPVEQLAMAITEGLWFDGSSIQGFVRIMESDMLLKPDLKTYSLVPWMENGAGATGRFICDVYTTDGQPFGGDPRYVLKRAIKEAADLGYIYNTGPELEFFIFKKEDDKLQTLPHDRGGYFDLTTDEAFHLRCEIVEVLEKMGIEVETAHHEVAPGQHEISFRYSDALTTADNAVTLKTVVKAIAQRNGLHATFMPKPLFGVNGSGMHVHQSLFSIDSGKNAFYREDDKYHLSALAYHFLAGQLEHIKAMSAIISPLVNSYKRLTPGYEAACYICWAQQNRSALIRVPKILSGKEQAARLELRSPDATCNIYLAFAVMLKAGLDGVKRELPAPEPVEEDVFSFNEEKLQAKGIKFLPPHLYQAIKELKEDEVVKDALGQHIYQHYINAKIKEWDEYRLQVTPWEIDKYLEIY